MLNIIKKALKEPLIHFMLLGSLIYLYYAFSQEPLQNTKQQIILEDYEIQALKDEYKKERFKSMNAEELNAYSKHKLYEKTLLEEAYSLNLHTQSKEISELLLKQMKFILLNESAFVEPTEEELLEYYKQNIKDYSEVAKLSFSHIYFSNSKDKDIEKTYEIVTYANLSPKKAAYFGETSDISNYQDSINKDDVEKIFGKYFANKLFNIKSRVWNKAIHSKHGVHLVYVRDKKSTNPYEFDDVLERVYQDYIQAKRVKSSNDAYKRIEERYLALQR